MEKKRINKVQTINFLLLLVFTAIVAIINILPVSNTHQEPVENDKNISFSYLLSLIFSIIFFIQYIFIWINTRRNKLRFLGSYLSLLTTAAVFVIILFFSADIYKEDFSDIEGVSLLPFYQLSINSSYWWTALLLVPVLLVLLKFKMEMDNEHLLRRSDLEEQLEAVAGQYHGNLFKESADLNKLICEYSKNPQQLDEKYWELTNIILKFNESKLEKDSLKHKDFLDQLFWLDFATFEICGFLKNCEYVGGDFSDVFLDLKSVSSNNNGHTINLSLFDCPGNGIIGSLHLPKVISFLKDRGKNFKNKSCKDIAPSFNKLQKKAFENEDDKKKFIHYLFCQINKQENISLVNSSKLYSVVYHSSNRSNKLQSLNATQSTESEPQTDTSALNNLELQGVGDILLLYTSGFPESLSSNGFANLEKIISQYSDLSTLVNVLINDIKKTHLAKKLANDFSCILIKKIK